MEGILAIADDDDVFSAIEKGIANGAIAHATAFEFFEPLDFWGDSRRPCCQDDDIAFVCFFFRHNGEFFGIPDANDFVVDDFDAQIFGLG